MPRRRTRGVYSENATTEARAVFSGSAKSQPPLQCGGAHSIFIIFRPYLRAVSTVNALSAPPVPRPHRHCSAGGAHGIFIIFCPYLRTVSTASSHFRPFRASSSPPLQCGGAHGIFIIFRKLPVHTAPFPFIFIIFCNSAVHTTTSGVTLHKNNLPNTITFHFFSTLPTPIVKLSRKF